MVHKTMKALYSEIRRILLLITIANNYLLILYYRPWNRIAVYRFFFTIPSGDFLVINKKITLNFNLALPYLIFEYCNNIHILLHPVLLLLRLPLIS